MNVKARRTKKQVNVENQAIMLLSKEELDRKIEVIKKELSSYTWRDLETNDKFAKKMQEAMPLSQLFEVLFDSCIFRKNRALAPHERSSVPLGNDIIPVTICKYQQLAHLDNHRFHDAFLQLSS